MRRKRRAGWHRKRRAGWHRKRRAGWHSKRRTGTFRTLLKVYFLASVPHPNQIVSRIQVSLTNAEIRAFTRSEPKINLQQRDSTCVSAGLEILEWESLRWMGVVLSKLTQILHECWIFSILNTKHDG